MSVQEGTVLASEMQRSSKLCAYGSYEINQTPPKTQPGATTVGGDVSEFEIPAKCINQSMYKLEFTLTTSSHNVPKVFIDGVCPIREVQFMTQGGRYMAYIPQFNKFTNATFRRVISFNKLATMERVIQTQNTAQIFEGLSMTTLGGVASLDEGTPNTIVRDRIRLPVTAGDMLPPNEPYLEPSMIVQRSAAGTLAVNFKIPLNLVKDSIFGVNRDINFNEITLIRIIWDDPAYVGFVGSSLINTNSGLATLTSYAISNLVLRYAVQKNQSIIDMVKEEKAQEIMIPYVYYNKIQGNAGNNNSTTLSVKFSNVHGSRLLRMYWAPYNNTESATTIFDHDNLGGLKVFSFHVEVDGVRLCPYEFLTNNSDDYDANRMLLDGSCILSRNDHLKYFTHVQNFGSNYPLCREFDYERQLWKEGMPLDKEVKIDIYYTNAPANAVQSQNYIYTVVQRRLVVDKEAGIYIDSGAV